MKHLEIYRSIDFRLTSNKAKVLSFVRATECSVVCT